MQSNTFKKATKTAAHTIEKLRNVEQKRLIVFKQYNSIYMQLICNYKCNYIACYQDL